MAKIQLGADKPCKQEGCSYWEHCPFKRNTRECLKSPSGSTPMEELEEVS